MSSASRPKIDYVLFDMDGGNAFPVPASFSTQKRSTPKSPVHTQPALALETIESTRSRHDFGAVRERDDLGYQGRVHGQALVAVLHLLSSTQTHKLNNPPPNISSPVSPTFQRHSPPKSTSWSATGCKDTLWHTTAFLPGAKRLLLHLSKHKTRHLAEVFGDEGPFAVGNKMMNVVCGDDLRADAEPIKGKPAPDIFLVAARDKLGRDVGFGDADDVGRSAKSRTRTGSGVRGRAAGSTGGITPSQSYGFPDPNLLALNRC
ncbi:hypothetical protein C8F01DRAFT_1264939 [Mycena amicta]|nr:hypothetical protein C8F01DRAFT_1264939 [Mycena amicta]